MSSRFEGAKGSAQFYWRQEDGEANCGVFHEPRQGHAYSICRAPRYVSEDQWMQDGGFIADAFNVHTETGLTPRQLAEQRAALLEALREAMEWNWLDDDARPSRVAEKCDAAIALAQGDAA